MVASVVLGEVEQLVLLTNNIQSSTTFLDLSSLQPSGVLVLEAQRYDMLRPPQASVQRLCLLPTSL